MYGLSLTFLVLCLLMAGCERASAVGPGGKASPTSAPATMPTAGAFDKVEKTDAQWRELLTPLQYSVLRQKGTERPGTGQYEKTTAKGTYVCAACGLELFTSNEKFDSHCGWPAFYAAKAGDRVKLTPDDSHGVHRVEVTCARCGSHLGHIFDDAPDQPTGMRYCINSVCLKFIPATQPSTQPATRPAKK